VETVAVNRINGLQFGRFAASRASPWNSADRIWSLAEMPKCFGTRPTQERAICESSTARANSEERNEVIHDRKH
jgi:hypothetical protein